MNASVASHTDEPIAAQPDDVRLLSKQERDRLIISSICVDGTWIVKSYYGDDIWHLTQRATNKANSKGFIDFTRLPEAYRGVLKEILYRYQRRGREGQAKPSATTLTAAVSDLKPFLRHLVSLKITRLSAVTPLVCSTYVAATKTGSLRRDQDKPLSPSHLMGRFKAVEMLYELSQFTSAPIPSHPWPDSSATQLAGGLGRDRRSTTPLMPDDVFAALFQEAHAVVQRGNALLELRDALDAVVPARAGESYSALYDAKHACLKKHKWKGGLKAFNSALLTLRDACYIVVASLSGCRNHELAYVQTGACYSTTDDDGAVYWWLRSSSVKTGAGYTEWLVPVAAVEALRVMDRWALPYQSMIADEIAARRALDPRDPEIAEAQRHSGAVFLGVSQTKGNQVRTLSDYRWNAALKAFMKRVDLNWDITTHQFRRKFANYAARSQFGDLRYLREHFKHWSQDMTNDAYALNESQEMELYAEIEDEMDAIKIGLAAQWLSASEPLAGGYGKSLTDWRSRDENVVLFKDHAAMVKSIAESHAIRSNGHAWCTADDRQCVGNTFEKTRCGDCSNAVIGRSHARIYQNLYADLKLLSTRTDIGRGGVARVLRDLVRCREVLTSLGYDPEAVAA